MKKALIFSILLACICLSVVAQTDNNIELGLNYHSWKVGVSYSHLPFPGLDVGSVEYGDFSISLEKKFKPRVWIGTGLGMGHWKYFERSVNRVIDQVSIDPAKITLGLRLESFSILTDESDE